MKRDPLRSASVVASLLAVLATTAPRLYAIDSNNRYFAYGLGQRTCQDYTRFRERRLGTLEQEHPRYTKDELYEIVNRIVEQWIAGFLTAHNLYVSDTYDIAGKSSMDDVKSRLEKGCRANPKQYFAEAMIAVVQQLNPQRVTSGKK
jgi:hypothetical protein